jgi:hypothetical protein
MIRGMGIVCSGLLLVAAGCAWQIGNTQVEASVKVDEQAVDATLEKATAKVQEELQRRGLQVSVSPEADAVRIVSAMKSGEKFTVVLRRARTLLAKEQTRVRVEWDTKSDRELWLALLVSVASATAQPH